MRHPSDPFAREVKEAVVAAQDQAQRTGCNTVGTAHLLCTLLADESSQAARALRLIHVDRMRLAREVAKLLPEGRDPTTVERPPLGDGARRALQLAAEEAQRMGYAKAYLEHLLVGISSEGQDDGAQILRRFALEYVQLAAAVTECAAESALLATEAERTPAHVEEETASLFESMQGAGSLEEKAKARERIIALNQGLVERLARACAEEGLASTADLIRVGTVGLMRAVDRFRAGPGNKFTTLAVAYITAEIRFYFRRCRKP